jgi:PKD repeat protein
VEPGTYTVTLTVNGRTLSKPLVVLEDKWMAER